jgi:hypothetical protein
LKFHANDFYLSSILELRIQGRWVESVSEKIWFERFFLPNPQSNVEKLWNWILFPLGEAVSTSLPKK